MQTPKTRYKCFHEMLSESVYRKRFQKLWYTLASFWFITLLSSIDVNVLFDFVFPFVEKISLEEEFSK